MRALGPQSVSSFLKSALDVAHGVAWIVAGITAPIGLGILLLIPFSSGQAPAFLVNAYRGPLAPLAAVLIALTCNLAALIFILEQLRKVMGALTEGDPFRPSNVGRLRLIGLGLIGLQVTADLFRAALNWLAPLSRGEFRSPWSLDLTAGFAVLVVFVLAEVFREGARLRREAELTI